MKKIYLLVIPLIFLAASCDTRPQIAVKPAANLKLIYLTFDADMTASMQARINSGEVKLWYDPQLFKYLEDNKIPSLIFTTGMFVEVYPDLIKELSVNNSFQFGNHSYDHPGFTKYCYHLNTINTDQEKIHQIQKAQGSIQKATGQTPKYFRFPGLCHMPADDALVISQGLKVMDADLVSDDAFNSNRDAIVKHILGNIKANDVVLMHVGGPNAPKDFEVLKTIVPILRDLGYTFAIK